MPATTPETRWRVLGCSGAPKRQRVEAGDRPRAHGEDVAQDAADAGRRALIGLDVARVVVALHLEHAGEPVADVDDAGVLARPLDHPGRRGRQRAQMDLRGLVRAVLVPHRREDAELGERRLAADQLANALVFVGLEAVRGDQRRRDLDFDAWRPRFSRHLASHGVLAGIRGWCLGGWYLGGPGLGRRFPAVADLGSAFFVADLRETGFFRSLLAWHGALGLASRRFRRAFDLFADFAMGLNVIAGRGPAIRQFDASTADGLAGSRGQVHPICNAARVLRRLREMIDQPGEQAAPVGRADRRLDVILRMRHQAEHVAAVVEDAGDGIGGAVEVPFRVEPAVGRGVAEEHPALAFEPRDASRASAT